MIRTRRWLMAGVPIVLGIGLMGPASGGESSSPGDMERYAREKSLSVATVVERFDGQDDFGVAVEEIRRIEPENFAWSIWRTDTNPHPVVILVRQPTQAVLQRLGLLPFPVDIQTSNSYTESELFEINSSLARALAELLPQHGYVVSPGYEGMKATVDVWGMATEPAGDVAVMAVMNDWKAKYPRVSFRYQPIEVSTVDTAVTGADAIGVNHCTAAFTVTSGTLKGISTAAHCNDGILTYQGNSITFGSASTVAQGDVQWHKFSSAVTLSNQIRISTTPTYRAITSVANPVVSSFVCYFGATTNQHCGNITSVGACDGSVCNLFTADTKSVKGGDSGGPWFFNQTGQGVTRGFMNVQINGVWQRLYDFGTRVSAYSQMGISVNTTP